MAPSASAEASVDQQAVHRNPRSWIVALYALALAVSISIWFLALRAPLWLDETGSYWHIKDGFSLIWKRRFIALGFPTYNFILWFWAKAFGTSEVALRSLSILAMLGAVWLLYLAARELFSSELALLAVILFCLDPIVLYASVDVRPYAFAVLAVNAAILILLRLRHSDSNWLAAAFGFFAALIVYFHYLFAAILPAFVLCFFILKAGNRKGLWRQFGIATAVFTVTFLPLIPGLQFLFHTSKSHVFEPPPAFADVVWTVGDGLTMYVFGASILVAGLLALSGKRESMRGKESWQIPVCASLALVPLLILYGISAATPIHMFTPRHRLEALPGVALCWALLVERCFTRPLRVGFCVALVTVTAYLYFTSPATRRHGYSWKYALEVAQKHASVDNSPVVICSDFPESDYAPMPLDSPKTSRYFAQLSYYKLSVPVIPMPRGLTAEARQEGSEFLREATRKKEGFLALASVASYPTLDWLAHSAAANYNVRKLAVLDDVEVLEFRPQPSSSLKLPPASRAAQP